MEQHLEQLARSKFPVVGGTMLVFITNYQPEPSFIINIKISCSVTVSGVEALCLQSKNGGVSVVSKKPQKGQGTSVQSVALWSQ